MKIAIIGGAGVRTPLLVRGLCTSGLPIQEVSLYDIDQDRLEVIGALTRDLAVGVPIRACATATECVEAATFVFLSVRVGGIARRARDERICLELGVVGQETVGPAGFSMAVRTIPTIVAYAEEIAAINPNAWIINLTNPVGMVTQAVLRRTTAKIVGICDTPTELFEEAAGVLGLDAARCRFEYFGLNHLGWLREIYRHGQPLLEHRWSDPDELGRLARASRFDLDLLASLHLLPTEYLFFYYHPERALENLRRANRTRGEAIEALNRKLFEDLIVQGADRKRTYAAYLAARDAGYMALETGEPRPRQPEQTVLTGYDRIAVSVTRAIHFNTGDVIPLNIANRGTIPELEPDDVIEVPCVVDEGCPWPLAVRPVPGRALELIRQVKRYERLTIEAALATSRELATTALAANPLVGSPDLARRLIDAMEPLW